MRIEKARVNGFGKISSQSFEFDAGLNCVFGPNESGKTTLLAFLVSMMYGQAKTGLKNRRLEDTHDHYRPWSAQSYAGSMTVEFGDGREVVVSRDFGGKADKVEITHGVSAVSLVAKYGLDRTGEPTFLREETGIDKATYGSVFVVRHDSVATLSPDERNVLADRLTALADTGDEESSSDRALEILGGSIAQIGSERAPTKPYAITRQTVDEQRARLEEARAVRDEYAEALSRRQELAGEAGRLESELENRRTLVAHSIIAGLRGMDEEIGKLVGALEKEPVAHASPALVELTAEQVRSAETKIGEFVRIRGEHQRTEGEAAALSARLTPMKAEYEAAIGTLQAVTAETREFIATAGDRKSDMLEEAGAKRERLEKARSLSRQGAVLKVLLAAAGLVAVSPVLVSFMGLAAPSWFHPGVTVVAGGAAAALLIWRILAIRGQLSAFEGEAEAFEQIRQRLEQHEGLLREICEAFGAQDREEAMEALEALDEKQRDITEAASRLAELQTNLERLADELQDAAEKAFDAASAAGVGPCASLCQAVGNLAETGEKTPPTSEPKLRSTYADVTAPGDVSKVFEALYAKVAALTESGRRTSDTRSRLSELERQRDSLLAGRSREEIEQSAAKALPEGTALLSREEIASQRNDIEAVEKRSGALRMDLAELSARIDEGLKGHPDLPDIEDAIARFKERSRLQQLHRDALDAAVRVVNEAAEAFHRQVFPRIESSLQGLLSRVTLGAHDGARLWTDESTTGPALRISVTDATKDAPVSPGDLSQGALEQVYLCARLALVDALTRDESLPVMLDDPFINYDPQRLEAAVEVLAEVAGKRQVFLFTCQEDVCGLAGRAGARITSL